MLFAHSMFQSRGKYWGNNTFMRRRRCYYYQPTLVVIPTNIIRRAIRCILDIGAVEQSVYNIVYFHSCQHWVTNKPLFLAIIPPRNASNKEEGFANLYVFSWNLLTFPCQGHASNHSHTKKSQSLEYLVFTTTISKTLCIGASLGDCSGAGSSRPSRTLMYACLSACDRKGRFGHFATAPMRCG